MRAVVQEVPQHWLDERARWGCHRHDEVWEGVLHMVTTPGFLHQAVAMELMLFLYGRLKDRGIGGPLHLAVFRSGPELDYRIPDLVFWDASREDVTTARGVEGAPLAVVEILSPGDETYEKMPFYAAKGAREMIVIDPESRAVEIFRLVGGQYVVLSPDDRGRLLAASIDLRFSTVDGPRLRVEHAGEAVEI